MVKYNKFLFKKKINLKRQHSILCASYFLRFFRRRAIEGLSPMQESRSLTFAIK